MATTASRQITYDWLSEYTEEYGPEGGGAAIVATVQTDWTEFNVRFFPEAIMGAHASAGGKIYRSPPEAHPTKPWLYCTNCKLARGLGALRLNSGNSMPEFYDPANNGAGKAIWQLTFGFLGYDVRSDEGTYDGAGAQGELRRWVRKRSAESLEALPIHGLTWAWSGTAPARPVTEPTSKVFSMVQLEYTWFWVPHPLRESSWKGMLGQVNSVAFDPNEPGANYDIETVYFQSYQKEPIMAPNGQLCSHVTFTFLVRKDGWNSFFRGNKVGGPDWDEVIAADGSGKKPYTPANLNTIFSAP